MFISRRSFVALAVGFLFVASFERLEAQTIDEEWDKLLIWKKEPIKVLQGDDELRRLLIQRHNEALSVVQLNYKEAISGRIIMEQANAGGWRLLNASLEAYESPKARIAFLKELKELADVTEKIMALKIAAGTIKHADMHASRQFRLDVDIQLLKAKKRAAKEEMR